PPYPSPSPLSLHDALPIYIFLCFLFHPWIGVAALIGALLLTSLTLFSEFMTRKPSRAAMAHVGTRNGIAEASRRNAEVIRAMGIDRKSTRLNSSHVKSSYA